MKFPLFSTMFITKPTYEDPFLQTLLKGQNILGVQNNSGGTMKFWKTDREVQDNDVQVVYTFECKDRHQITHYLIISVLDLIEENEYKINEQAYLFTFIDEIDSKYVRKVEEKMIEIKESALGNYKERFIEAS
jgi:predicted ATP-dependent protease